MYSNNISFIANSTPYLGDVSSCLKEHDVDSCVRIGLAFAMSVLTVILSIVRVIHCHIRKHKIYHHYVVLYSVAVQFVLLAVHWMVEIHKSAIIDLVVTYILAVQILVLCHYYVGWAARSQHHHKIFKFLVLPCLGALLLYFTGVIIWAGVVVEDGKTACYETQWVMFSVSNFVLALLFVVSGIYILLHLRDVRNNHKSFVKIQLLGFIIGYLVSTLLAFIYDIYVKFSGTRNCSAIFSVDKGVYVTIFIVHRTVKYFIPAWTAILFIHPNKSLLPAGVGVAPGNTDDFSDSSNNWAKNKNFKSHFVSEEDDEITPLLRPTTTPVSVSINQMPPRGHGYSSGAEQSCPENPHGVSQNSGYDAFPPLHSARQVSSGYASYNVQ